MKQNKGITSLALIMIVLGVLLVGGVSYKASQNNYVSEQIKSDNQNQTDNNKNLLLNIDLQAKCATQSETLLGNYRQEQKGVDISETNHFNNKLQKCLVNFSTRDTIVNVFGSEIRDAYENKVLLSCHSGGPISGTVCDIPSASSSTGESQRITKEDGEKIIKDYMSE